MKKLILLIIVPFILAGCYNDTKIDKETYLGASNISTIIDNTNFAIKVIIDNEEYNLIGEEDLKEKYNECRENSTNIECHSRLEEYLVKEKQKYITMARQSEVKVIIDYYTDEFDGKNIDLTKSPIIYDEF